MAGSENLGDIIYEEMFQAAKKLGIDLSRNRLHDFALVVDDGVKRRCGSERVYVPVERKDIRNERICKLKLAGKTCREIANKEGMSKSQVFTICQQYGV
ncbi:MAG: hypothetical protein HOM14_03595 [Gammaproteobacteria bacterium]|jgi:hypothetical protein|nr:hypothetical protein [Gammaproteobacteria bacterium]